MDEDFNNQTSKQTSNAMNKIKQGASNVANKVGKAIKSVGKKIVANPLFWKFLLFALGIIAGMLILVVMISAIFSLFLIDSYDKNNGTISSVQGINGDKFYGARFLYKDDETASYEIQDDYLKFTYTILTDSSIDGITLSSDYKTDETVVTIATSFANSLANLPQDETSSPTTTNYTFEQSTKIINHFGFKNEEVVIVIDSIANSIYNKGVSSRTLEEIKTTLSQTVENSKYDKYKKVCDKIFVYDYILDEKDASLEDLPKKNYVGFVFMPKEDVILKSTSFRFVVDGGYGVNTLIKFKNNSEITNLTEETNVDITWYDQGEYKTLDTKDINLSLSKFTAINMSNLSELETPVSIRTMLNEEKFQLYFNAIEGEYSSINLMDNINTTNYLYLTFSSFDPFNFAEYVTEY